VAVVVVHHQPRDHVNKWFFFSDIFHIDLCVYLADNNIGASARAISPSKPPAASIQPPPQMPQVPSSNAATSYYDQSSGNKSKFEYEIVWFNL